MLQKIVIKNYSLIRELDISFSPHLNIITGETGAGKSIILGALSLIFGSRADSSVLADKNSKCVVEGYFNISGKKAVAHFLESNEWDVSDEELIVRKEISPNGKSRAFVNDTPATVTLLQQLSSLMVDLHQQFDITAVGDIHFQRKVLDAFAEQTDVVTTYNKGFEAWQLVNARLEELQQQKLNFQKEYDYNLFQFTEIDEAGFKPNELEEIDERLKLLNNTEDIKSVLNRINYTLKEGDTPLVAQIKTLVQQLNQIAGNAETLTQLANRLQSVQIELNDIAGDCELANNQFIYDPETLQILQDRQSLGYKLQKKHGVNSTAELLLIAENLNEKLSSVLNIDNEINLLQKEAAVQELNLNTTAEKISRRREKTAGPFTEKVNNLLLQMGMPNARIKVVVKTLPQLNAWGNSQVEFLFNGNIAAAAKNTDAGFLPIKKVASGGEQSRLMLAIKSLVAANMDLPTLIFDEIDTGISGEAARQVGFIMKNLGTNRQVIAITHQPQIAGRGDAHFFVYKKEEKGIINTSVKLLEKTERVHTIAQMLSGEKPTEAALKNALELIESN